MGLTNNRDHSLFLERHRSLVLAVVALAGAQTAAAQGPPPLPDDYRFHSGWASESANWGVRGVGTWYDRRFFLVESGPSLSGTGDIETYVHLMERRQNGTAASLGQPLILKKEDGTSGASHPFAALSIVANDLCVEADIGSYCCGLNNEGEFTNLDEAWCYVGGWLEASYGADLDFGEEELDGPGIPMTRHAWIARLISNPYTDPPTGPTLFDWLDCGENAGTITPPGELFPNETLVGRRFNLFSVAAAGQAIEVTSLAATQFKNLTACNDLSTPAAGVFGFHFVRGLAVAGWYRGDATFGFSAGQSSFGCNLNQTLPLIQRSSGALADAFIALVDEQLFVVHDIPNANHPDPERPQGVLSIRSTGSDRALGVAFDHTTGAIIVCGTLGGDIGERPADIHDLDPSPYRSRPRTNEWSPQGNGDLFVAAYRYGQPNTSSEILWHLDWYYLLGTSGEDVATTVAVDVTGSVFVGGYTNYNAGTGGNPWFAKFDRFLVPDIQLGSMDPNEGSQFFAPVWAHNPQDLIDQRVHDVTIDPLGRAVFVGEFDETLVLPSATGSNKELTSAGASDGFTARYLPDGTLDWAFRTGSIGPDATLRVSSDEYVDNNLVLGGNFEGTVDLDPSTGSHPVTSPTAPGGAFLSSSFVAVMEPAMLEGFPDRSIELVMHQSFGGNEAGFVTVDPTPYLAANSNVSVRRPLLAAIAAEIESGDPSRVPLDGSVAFGATIGPICAIGHDGYRTSEFPDGVPYRWGSMHVVPLTILTAETAPLVAARLRSLSPNRIAFNSETGENSTGWVFKEAVTLAAQRNARIIPVTTTPAVHRHLWTITHAALDQLVPPGTGTLAVVAQNLFDEGWVTEFHGIRSRSWGDSPMTTSAARRTQAGERLAFSKGGRAFRTGWSTSLTTTTPQERKAAMFEGVDSYDDPTSAGTPNPQLVGLMQRMIWRMAHPPGDFNRDGVTQAFMTYDCSTGVVSVNPTGADWDAFLAASLPQVQDPYADWSFDGIVWDGDDRPPLTPINLFGIDFSKFFSDANPMGCLP